jgi:small subunit ribosomal protein S17
MPKMIYGIVSSKKTDKTIVVTEHVRLTHPLYRKQYTVTKKFMAHDENNEAQEGDKVAIVETRPLSARKHFKLDRVMEKAGVKHVESDTPEVLKKAEKPAKADKVEAASEKGPTAKADKKTADEAEEEK